MFQQDSGGPLMFYDEDTRRYAVVGLASWGFGCTEPNYPGVYCDVYYYKNWLVNNMGHSTEKFPKPSTFPPRPTLPTFPPRPTLPTFPPRPTLPTFPPRPTLLTFPPSPTRSTLQTLPTA